MLDMISVIYEVPITAFYEDAVANELSVLDYHRFKNLYRSFSNDLLLLKFKQQYRHVDLLAMLQFVNERFRRLLEL